MDAVTSTPPRTARELAFELEPTVMVLEGIAEALLELASLNHEISPKAIFALGDHAEKKVAELREVIRRKGEVEI